MRYQRTPASNPNGLAGLMLDPKMRQLVRERAEIAKALYQARVAKRTGVLAREVRVVTYIGGPTPRWCARVIAHAPHAASHEFGADGRPGAHDWPAVLAQLGGAG
ncbi:hypothetical protein [Rhodococcus zopfii]|uniref:hypothetical protein n=1 Tax=Rhodococcus zopfii TaxID=43772 RepID=UPI000933FF38|nr:hypothetical protein [Rhodococcus zopfii]